MLLPVYRHVEVQDENLAFLGEFIPDYRPQRYTNSTSRDPFRVMQAACNRDTTSAP